MRTNDRRVNGWHLWSINKAFVIAVIPGRIEGAITAAKPMLRTVEGIYRNGQIELTDLPNDSSDRTQVLVTFLDAATLDPAKLRQLIDQLETLAGIQQGLEEVNIGQTRPIEDFVQEMQQKYGISG